MSSRQRRTSGQGEKKTKGHSFWTAQRDGEVRLRRRRGSLEDEAPLTVPDMVLDTAIKFADCLALSSKYRDGWQVLSYIEYYELCRRAAKSFLKLGLERFHGVGIMGFNSAEWVIACIGAIMAGGFSVGLLPTNTPKTCQVIAENSEIDIFVVDSDRQLQKVLQIQSFLKPLKAIVQYKELLQMDWKNLYSWKAFLDLGEDVSDDRLDRVIDSQKPNQCCSLVCSLGAGGPPKIIMLSHDNVSVRACPAAASRCPPDGRPPPDHLDRGGRGAEPLLQVPARGAGGAGELPAAQLHRGADLRRVGGHLRGGRAALSQPRGRQSGRGRAAARRGLPDGAAARGAAHHLLRRPVGVGPNAGERPRQPAGRVGLAQDAGPVGHARGPGHQQAAHVPAGAAAAVLPPGQEADLRPRQEAAGAGPLPAVLQRGAGAAAGRAGLLPQPGHPHLRAVRHERVHGRAHPVRRRGLPAAQLREGAPQHAHEAEGGGRRGRGQPVHLGPERLHGVPQRPGGHPGAGGQLRLDEHGRPGLPGRGQLPLRDGQREGRHHAQLGRGHQPQPHRDAGEDAHPHRALRPGGGPGRPLPVCAAHAQVPDQLGHRGASDGIGQRGCGHLQEAQEPVHQADRHPQRPRPHSHGVHQPGHRGRQRGGPLGERQDCQVGHSGHGLLRGGRRAGNHHQNQEGGCGQEVPSRNRGFLQPQELTAGGPLRHADAAAAPGPSLRLAAAAPGEGPGLGTWPSLGNCFRLLEHDKLVSLKRWLSPGPFPQSSG